MQPNFEIDPQAEQVIGALRAHLAAVLEGGLVAVVSVRDEEPLGCKQAFQAATGRGVGIGLSLETSGLVHPPFPLSPTLSHQGRGELRPPSL